MERGQCSTWVERLRCFNPDRVRRTALHALGSLAVAGALLTTVAGTAQAADSVRAEVWIWQHGR